MLVREVKIKISRILQNITRAKQKLRCKKIKEKIENFTHIQLLTKSICFFCVTQKRIIIYI